jgi:adenylate cyclase
MVENHRQCAIDAALEMRKRLSRVNLALSKQGYPPLRHGIGLHAGKVVAANIGSPQRLSYALVGETVNIASRIQNLNKDFETDILFSDAVYTGTDQKMGAYPLQPVSVKGIRKPLQLFGI